MSIQIAEQYEANEEFEKAYEEYKKTYDENPKNMNVLERLGHICLMLEKKEEAAEYYSQILEFDKTNTMVYEQLMDIYQDTDKYKYYINRGNLHTIEHKFEHAINDYKKALAHTQNTEEIQTTSFVVASLYAQTGNRLKAIDEYLKLIEYENIPPETFLNLAKLYLEESAPSSAINVLERALGKGIENANIRENLAFIYLKENQPQKAKETTHDPLFKVKCMLECGEADEAFAQLEQCGCKEQQPVKYYPLAAQYYFTKKDFDKALDAVLEFEKLEKNSPLTYQMKALIYENKNDDYNAHLNWGKFNIVRGNLDIAINEFLNAYQLNDTDLDLIRTLAAMLEEHGDKNHAMEFYEKLSKLDECDITALSKLADFRNSIGDYKAECEYLEKWYEIDKRNLNLIKRLAQSYERLKNKPSSIEFYKKYLQVATTAEDYEKIKAHLAKLENTEMQEEEGLIDKIMRMFNK